MKLPENLRYSRQHLWVRQDKELFYAGITDYAQDLLGDIVYVEFPVIGSTVQVGLPCGLVESVKTGSDLHAPMSGVVEAVNDDLKNQPELINEDPYKAWIFSFRAADANELASLLDAAAYRELLEEADTA